MLPLSSKQKEISTQAPANLASGLISSTGGKKKNSNTFLWIKICWFVVKNSLKRKSEHRVPVVDADGQKRRRWETILKFERWIITTLSQFFLVEKYSFYLENIDLPWERLMPRLGSEWHDNSKSLYQNLSGQ